MGIIARNGSLTHSFPFPLKVFLFLKLPKRNGLRSVDVNVNSFSQVFIPNVIREKCLIFVFIYDTMVKLI